MTTVFSSTTFIKLALDKGVLRFGEFTLKSGRISPYFFNAGLLNDGACISSLAAGYANLIADQKVDVIFGPAYKGIPLAAATAQALHLNHSVNVAWGYNRKEVKDHGEGGLLVGADVTGKTVWIVDDVITAGTAIREVISILHNAGAIIGGIVVTLDRQEKGTGELSAIQELQQTHNIPVLALVTMRNLMDYLQTENNTDSLASMVAYQALYGI